MKKLRDQEIDNARILRADAAHLLDWFEKGEVEGLYLNFSDPWPKLVMQNDALLTAVSLLFIRQS
mgnify:CR=1 FL=1